MAERCICAAAISGIRTDVEGDRLVTRFYCLACGGETQPPKIESAHDWHI